MVVVITALSLQVLLIVSWVLLGFIEGRQNAKPDYIRHSFVFTLNKQQIIVNQIAVNECIE